MYISPLPPKLIFIQHIQAHTHTHLKQTSSDPLLICLHYLLPCLIYCLIASLPHCSLLLLLSLSFSLTLLQSSSSSPHHSPHHMSEVNTDNTVSLSTSLSLSLHFFSHDHPLNHRLLPQHFNHTPHRTPVAYPVTPNHLLMIT